jgi:hypothetical protein
MTTTTRLVHPECKAMKVHLIEWAGIGLCCIHDYSGDGKREPRSYTRPIETIAELAVKEAA